MGTRGWTKTPTPGRKPCMAIWRGPANRGRMSKPRSGPGGGPAQRIRARGWRDPRLAFGLVLVLVTTIIGAQLFRTHDRSVGYWALAGPVKAGESVVVDDLVEVQVQLSGATRERYLRSDEIAAGDLNSRIWVRDLRAGGLIPPDALADPEAKHDSQLPLAVEDGALPADLQRGDVVDVWVGPDEGDAPGDSAEAVLRGATVLSAGQSHELGAATRTVLVEVDPDLAPSVITAIGAGHITLVRVQPWTS